MTTPVLIEVDQLRRGLAGGESFVLLDVRWALGDPNGHRHYLDGHLPGAVFVDLETELAATPTPEHGRHPLPSIDQLQSAAWRWGIDTDAQVVVYDATGGLAAARAWWLLRWGSVAGVRILNGGLAAWTESGGELATGSPRPPKPGDAVLTAGGMPVIDIDEAAAWPQRGALLDARAGERYRGEVEPVDPRAGHIPGAISVPTTENIDSAGRFAQAARLQARFADYADRPVAVYCGSGVTAAHEIAALAVAGIDAALYPGSWSQWSSDPARPAATD